MAPKKANFLGPDRESEVGGGANHADYEREQGNYRSNHKPFARQSPYTLVDPGQ